MDIVVTIPKSEYTNNLNERKYQKENINAFGFRTFKNIPKQLKVGDRIYFVKNGIVSYSKKIIKIDTASTKLKCDVTKKKFVNKGCFIYFNNEQDESHLNIKCKGFRGFRYKWW